MRVCVCVVESEVDCECESKTLESGRVALLSGERASKCGEDERGHAAPCEVVVVRKRKAKAGTA